MTRVPTTALCSPSSPFTVISSPVSPLGGGVDGTTDSGVSPSPEFACTGPVCEWVYYYRDTRLPVALPGKLFLVLITSTHQIC